MDRRKPRPSTSAADDDLAAVKAAAWAWYQRGSGNEGKPASEFDLASSPRAPRTSRYRLEALWAAAPDPSPPPPTHAADRTEGSNSLLDVYEIDRITQELDRLIDSSRRGGSRAGKRVDEEGKRVATRVSGFWVRHALGICGARGEVVEAIIGQRRRGRRGEAGSYGFGAV